MNVTLKRAYDLEKLGLELYINSACNSNNALVKRTIFSLAKEEIAHMMKIDELMSSFDVSGKWMGEEAGIIGSGIENEMKKFFESANKEILNENKDNVEIIKKVMEFEKKSYEFYDDLGRKAGTDVEKRFYSELKKQEAAHFDALQNVYYYLTKTGDWFKNDESNVWGWMNL